MSTKKNASKKPVKRKRTTKGTGLVIFSKKSRERFCELLCAYPNVSQACRELEISTPTAYSWKKKDPEFSAAWDEAIETGVNALEDEVLRRAMKGVIKPVFYQGEICGHVVEFSDSLATFLLKANRPEKYRERTDINIGLKGNSGVLVVDKEMNEEEWLLAANATKVIDADVS